MVHGMWDGEWDEMVDEVINELENKPNPRNKRDTLQAIKTRKIKRDEFGYFINQHLMINHFILEPKIKSSPIFSIASVWTKKNEKNNYKRYIW